MMMMLMMMMLMMMMLMMMMTWGTQCQMNGYPRLGGCEVGNVFNPETSFCEPARAVKQCQGYYKDDELDDDDDAAPPPPSSKKKSEKSN